MSHELVVTTPSAREIEWTRTFDAPRELVWEAHTQCQHLKRWLLGPDGWWMEVCTVDLRPGGRYRWEWHHQDGRVIGVGGEYQEVERPERIVHSEQFDDDWTGGEAHVTLTLEADDENTTTLRTRVRYSSEKARDGAMATGMMDGVSVSYDRLDEVLADVSAEV